jgi:hypothetical protein
MARGRVPLAAFGIAALLTLIPVAVGGGSTAAAPALSDPVKTVALLSVQFLNDHEDLEPTTDAERARLASIAELFKSKLEASARYKFASIPADAAAKIAAGPDIGNCGGCEFDYGKQVGGDFAAWIVVQKISDLILNINVYMADVAAKRRGPWWRPRRPKLQPQRAQKRSVSYCASFTQGSKQTSSQAIPIQGCRPRLAERPKRRAHLLREELRLFPGGEVSALVDLMEVDQVAIGSPRPCLRGSIDVVRKHRDGDQLSGAILA